MQTPDTKAGRLTDKIMMSIHEHIKRDGPYDGSQYNKAWGKVHEILKEELK